MAKKRKPGPKPKGPELLRKHGVRVTFNDPEMALLNSMKGTYALASYVRSCAIELTNRLMNGEVMRPVK